MSMRIRDVRISQGKTLEALANQVGLCRSALSEIERGKRSANARQLGAIALSLRVSVGALSDSQDVHIVRAPPEKPSNLSAPALVGRRLRSLRKSRRLSQSALARAIDVTPQALNNWESGRTRPRIEIAERIIDELGVTLDLLFLGRS